MDALFDPALVASRRRRALREAKEGADFLFNIAAEEIAGRLGAVERQFPQSADLFPASGRLAQACARTGRTGMPARIDIAGIIPDGDGQARDLEDVPLARNSLNLVVSALALHLVNDLPGALARIRQALQPDGLFLAAIPGGNTLSELNDILVETEVALSGGASPRVIPFADVRSLGALLQRAGFSLPVVDTESYIVRYDSLFSLMADLRAFGMTNMLAARSKKPVTRSFFLEAARRYQQKYSDPDGRIRATFEIIYLSGWAPHESQQKPLRPGSARMRLLDALKPEGTPEGA